jgi:phosphatidylglycerophosphate synthase
LAVILPPPVADPLVDTVNVPLPTLGILAPTIFIVEFPLWLAVNVPPPDALPLVVTVNVPLPTDGIDGNVARFPWPVTY